MVTEGARTGRRAHSPEPGRRVPAPCPGNSRLLTNQRHPTKLNGKGNMLPHLRRRFGRRLSCGFGRSKLLWGGWAPSHSCPQADRRVVLSYKATGSVISGSDLTRRRSPVYSSFGLSFLRDPTEEGNAPWLLFKSCLRM